MTSVGMLHPGEMGAAVGAAVLEAGAEVFWVPEGRSPATAERARAAGLQPAPLEDLLERCEVVLSVIPPHAAVTLANKVAGLGFGGVFVDANAVSPKTARRVAEIVRAAGASYVDGGIIGPPPVPGRGSTTLCLSGPAARKAASLFEGSALATRVLGEDETAASALKMCYAAWTKGSAALLLATVATADTHGVLAELFRQWEVRLPDLEGRAGEAAAEAAAKAWRWVSEMEEISDTFDSAGVPGGFHAAAAELYGRLSEEAPSASDLATVTAALRSAGQRSRD